MNFDEIDVEIAVRIRDLPRVPRYSSTISATLIHKGTEGIFAQSGVLRCSISLTTSANAIDCSS